MSRVEHVDLGADEQEFERLLVESARADGIPREATLAAWVQFGSSTGLLGASVGHAGSSQALAVAVRRASLKWLVIGAIGGGAMVAMWMNTRRSRPAEHTAAVAAVAGPSLSAATSHPVAKADSVVVAREEPVVRREAAGAGAVDEAHSGDAHSARLRPRDVAHPTGPTAGASARTRLHEDQSTLSAEVEALDGVRAAISARAFQRAVGLVRNYHRDFPRGQLSADADALSLEALAGAGDQAEAAEGADRFLEKYPDDPHAARVRALTVP